MEYVVKVIRQVSLSKTQKLLFSFAFSFQEDDDDAKSSPSKIVTVLTTDTITRTFVQSIWDMIYIIAHAGNEIIFAIEEKSVTCVRCLLVS